MYSFFLKKVFVLVDPTIFSIGTSKDCRPGILLLKYNIVIN
jgi:hypothetical protein